MEIKVEIGPVRKRKKGNTWVCKMVHYKENPKVEQTIHVHGSSPEEVNERVQEQYNQIKEQSHE